MSVSTEPAVQPDKVVALGRRRSHVLIIDHNVDAADALPNLLAVAGRDIARRVRAQPWARSTRLLAITGWGAPELQAECAPPEPN